MDEDSKAFIGVPGTPALVSRDELPPALANTLDHIVGQLSLISRTMVIFEQRLSLTENRISALMASSRGLNIILPEMPNNGSNVRTHQENCGLQEYNEDEEDSHQNNEDDLENQDD